MNTFKFQAEPINPVILNFSEVSVTHVEGISMQEIDGEVVECAVLKAVSTEYGIGVRRYEELDLFLPVPMFMQAVESHNPVTGEIRLKFDVISALMAAKNVHLIKDVTYPDPAPLEQPEDGENPQ